MENGLTNPCVYVLDVFEPTDWLKERCPSPHMSSIDYLSCVATMVHAVCYNQRFANLMDLDGDTVEALHDRIKHLVFPLIIDWDNASITISGHTLLIQQHLPDPTTVFLKQLETAVENGDYLPTKLRRALYG